MPSDKPDQVTSASQLNEEVPGAKPKAGKAPKPLNRLQRTTTSEPMVKLKSRVNGMAADHHARRMLMWVVIGAVGLVVVVVAVFCGPVFWYERDKPGGGGGGGGNSYPGGAGERRFFLVK